MADLYQDSEEAGSKVRSIGQGRSALQRVQGEYLGGASSFREAFMKEMDRPAPVSPSRGAIPTRGLKASSGQSQEDILASVLAANPYKPEVPVQPEPAPQAKAPGADSQGTLMGDVGRSLARGAINLGAGIYELANFRGLLDEGVQKLTGTTGTEFLRQTSESLNQQDSAELQRQREQLKQADGFWNSFGTVLTNPRLMGSMAIEMVPQLVPVLGAAKVASTVGAARAATAARAAGKTAEEVAQIATTAGQKAATRTVLGLNTAIESGAAASDVRADILTMKEEELDNSPQYRKLVSEYGGDSNPQARSLARQRLANDAATMATAVAAPISLVANTFTAGLEARIATAALGDITGVVTRQAARREAAKALGSAVIKEPLQEGIEEGGSQFAGNVGRKYSGANPEQDLLEGVPQAAGAGAAMGLVAGAGFGSLNARAELKKAEQPKQQGESTIRPPATPGAGTDLISDEQFISLIRNDQGGRAIATLAALNEQAVVNQDTQAQQKYTDIAARMGVLTQFQEASKNVDQVRIGNEIITEDPQFVAAFDAKIDQFLNAKPDQNVDMTPGTKDNLRAQQAEARDAEVAQAEGFQAAQDAEAAQVLNKEADQEFVPGFTDTGERDIEADGTQVPIVERNLDKFQKVADSIGEILAPSLRYQRAKELAVKMADEGVADADIESVVGDLLSSAEKPNKLSRQMVERLVESRTAKGILVRENEYQDAELPPGIVAIGKAMKVNVVGFRYTGNQKGAKANGGMSIGKGTVLINMDKPDPLRILGHEVFHELARRNKRAGAQLIAQVKKYISEEGRAEMADFLNDAGYKQAKFDEEMAADVLGILFKDQRFWDKLAVAEPNLMSQIMDVVRDLINKLKGALRTGTRPDVAKYITDYEKVLDVMARGVQRALKRDASDTGSDAMDDEGLSNLQRSALKNQFEPRAKQIRSIKDQKVRDQMIQTAMKTMRNAKFPESVIERTFGEFTQEKPESQAEIPQPKPVTPIKAEPKNAKSKRMELAAAKQLLDPENPRYVLRNKPEAPEPPAPRQREMDVEVEEPNFRQKLERIVPEQVITPRMQREIKAIEDRIKGLRTGAIEDGVVGDTNEENAAAVARGSDAETPSQAEVKRLTKERDDMIRGAFERNPLLRAFADENATPEQLRAYADKLIERINNLVEKEVEAGNVSEAEARTIANVSIGQVNNAVEALRPTTEPELTANEEPSLFPDEPSSQSLDEAKKFVEGMKKFDGQDFMRSAQKAMRERVFDLGQLRTALFQAGAKVPESTLSAFSEDAFKYSLDYYLKKNGGGYLNINAWLASLDRINGKVDPELTDGEKRLYDDWKQSRQSMLNRLQERFKRQLKQTGNEISVETVPFTDPEDAFPNALFVRYPYAMMADPQRMDKKERAALTSTIDEPETAWIKDVLDARVARPDLKQKIVEMLEPAGLQAVKRYIRRNRGAEIRAAKVMASSQDFIKLQQMKNLPDNVYGEFYEALSLAKSKERAVILQHAAEMDAMAEAGKLAGKEVDFTDYLRRVEQVDLVNSSNIDQLAWELKEASVDQLRVGYGSFENERALENARDELSGDLQFPEEDIEDHFDDAPRAKRGNYSGVVTHAETYAKVKELTQDWDGPPAKVLQDPTQIQDEQVRRRIMAKIGQNSAKGAFDVSTGQVYLFSDYMESLEDVEATLFHEVYGHRGSRIFLGEKFDSFMERQYRINQRFRNNVNRTMEQNGIGMLEAADEVAADLVTKDPEIFKSLIGMVAKWLRDHNWDTVASIIDNTGDKELAYVLGASRKAARDGTYMPKLMSDEVRLALARKPIEMFAIKDGQVSAYARYNPISRDWYVFTAGQGKDFRQGATATSMPDYDQVVDTLKKIGRVEVRSRSGYYLYNKIPTDFTKMPTFNDKEGMSKLLRSAHISLLNQYLPVFEMYRWLKANGRTDDSMDVEYALKMYETKAAVHIEDFRKIYVQPIMDLVEKVKEEGGTIGDIEDFLYARHAEERNAAIRKINPTNNRGSGMTDQEALQVKSALSGLKYSNSLDKIGELVDRMSKAKVAYMHQTGLIDTNTADALGNYEHYVNLSGIEELDLEKVDPSTGRAFNLRGKDAVRALGRTTKAQDILARTIVSYENTLIRGQKNHVAQTMLKLMENNYDPDVVSVNRISMRKAIGEDGYVTLVEDSSYLNRDNVMVAKVDGKTVTMEFKDEGPGSVVEALHGKPKETGPLIEALGTWQRFFGQLITTWNPVWIPVNGLRDIQTAFSNSAADPRIGVSGASKMMAAIPKSLRYSYRQAFGRSVDPKLDGYYNEFRNEGGITLFLDRNDIEKQKKDIDFLLTGKTDTADMIRRKLSVIGETMEKLGTPMEQGVRLAAYSTLRDMGWSVKDAALYAKELTVNFNMRGTNKTIRSLYVFFNPAVQGTARMLQDIKGGRFWALASAWALLGMGATLIAGALSDEEEGEEPDKLRRLPTYARATKMILKPDSDLPGTAIPIAYGWNAFYATGTFMMDTVLGKVPIETTMKRIFNTAMDAFSPIGANVESATVLNKVIKTVTPTMALPILELGLNENRFGGPIYKTEAYGGGETSASWNHFDSVSPLSRGLARGLNEAFGGNRYRDVAQVNPAVIDYLIQSYLPGLATETYKLMSTAVRAASGEELSRTPWPLVDRFRAYVPEGWDAGAIRRVEEAIGPKVAEYNKLRDVPGIRDRLDQENKNLLGVSEIISDTKQNIRKLRSEMSKLQDKPGVSEKELVERKNEVKRLEKYYYGLAEKAAWEAGFQKEILGD